MAQPVDPADDFIDGGLALLGIEADAIERAVIGAAHALFWPGILEMTSIELPDGHPEPDRDLSRAPREEDR